MIKNNLTNRQVQALNTKKKIFNASMELMDKKGFENTTIDEISKRANVSVGAFYHYYKSKDDIFFELYKIADEYFEGEVYTLLQGKTAQEQLILFFQHYAKYNKARGLDAIRQLYNAKNKYFISKDRYMRILLEQIISDGLMNNELFSNMTPDETTEYFFIFARGIIYDWCLHDADYNLEEKMKLHIELLINVFTQ